jgi:hypothetical protein
MKVVNAMPNKSDYDNAAKKAPSERSAHEQSLVDKGKSAGMQSVKNFDHEAQRNKRIFG